MIIRTLLFALLFLPLSASGQAKPEAPDMERINKEVGDKSSPFYFPVLLRRYEQGDTTLSLSQKRHLYYGSSVAPGFSSYGSSNFQNSIRKILANEELIEADYVRLFAFTDSALKSDPFDLRTLNQHKFAAKKMGRSEAVTVTSAKIELLLDAILSTGDGKSSKTAFWVTGVSHEYFLLGVLGFEFGGSQSLVDGPCDYLSLKENEYGLKGLYFNVSISFSLMSDMFNDSKKGKKKQGR